MGIAQTSEKIVISSAIVTILCVLTSVLLAIFLNNYWNIAITGFIVIWTIFFIWFFRDPKRTIIKGEDTILAPADGVIRDIEIKDDYFSLTVRMSPFDVHLTRSPLDGVVKEVIFRKGPHWPVYFPNYAKNNQRNTIVIHNEEKGLEFEVVQISGVFARRAIAFVKVGDVVEQGQKIGIIRFGSMTYIKIKGAKEYIQEVSSSASAKAGLTVLARYKL